MLRLTPNAVPQGCLFGVILAGLALAVRGLAALWTGRERGWAVLERGERG